MYTLKKHLGQHFLHDENICKKIVDLVDFKEGSNLLEVGPGGGAITKYLLEKPNINYCAVEIDKEKVDYLISNYPKIANRIVNADILSTPTPFQEPFSIIGNFPYNISSPILFRTLEWEPQIIEIIGMFQKEVGERIACKPGSKTYGILSVLMQTFFKVSNLFEVHENCFTPSPKVKSCVLKFTNLHNPHNILNKRKYIILVKAAFNQRRKTLRNALKSTLQPDSLSNPLMDKRAEQLSVLDFVTLYNIFINEKHVEQNKQ